MSDDTPRHVQSRPIEIEQRISAPPEEVWSALTEPEGLRRWFPLDARVEPGDGGRIWLSWGPGSEGEAPIHVWDPPSRFGWTESYGEDDSGRPIEVAVDFHVETRDAVTVVRLVHSGFGASEEWDEMYHALVDGWTYFLFNLGFYFAKHRGQPRRMVWRRVATDLERNALWDRLIGGALIGSAADVGGTVELGLDQTRLGVVVSQRPGYHFTATIPELDDSVLFVELEGSHIGIWLSTYGLDDATTARLQSSLNARVESILGVSR